MQQRKEDNISESSHETNSKEDVAKLDRILELEGTHKQWLKHALCLIPLATQVIVNLVRGSKSSPSILTFFFNIPYRKCQTWYDVTLCVCFVAVCIFITVVAIKRNNYEQNFKIKQGRGICKSDLRFSPNIIRRLVTVAFIGGWVSGALGLGGGAIFNPVLLSMGIPPAVSGSTGMYLVMFTTLGSSITYMLLKQLNPSYAVWIGSWCILGTYLGMRLLDMMMKRWNRQSLIVFLLAGILGISALLIPIFGAMDLLEKFDAGLKDAVFKFDIEGVC